MNLGIGQIKPITDSVLQCDSRSIENNAIVKTGDAYDLLDTLEGSSVDLLITSPPYWGHRSYGGEHNWSVFEAWKSAGGVAERAPGYDWYRKAGGILGLEPFPEWYVAHLIEIFDKARPLLKPSASVWSI